MNRTDCPGLDGSNPLHFLASLGALRILGDTARLSWTYDGSWTPSFEHEALDFATRISQGVRRGLLDHGLVKEPVRRDGTRDKVKLDEDDRRKVAEAYSFLSFSPIPKAPAHVFRAAIKEASLKGGWDDPLHPLNTLSSLNAESPPDEEGNLEPTAFSFSNDCGGQVLHKDFINLASIISPMAVMATIEGRPERYVWCTSLNWDPKSLRSYAHQWEDPESQPKNTDVAANALAFIGLSFYPVVPGQKGSRTLGMSQDRKRFRWPLWDSPLSMPVLSSLLALSTAEQELRRGRGIAVMYESERFSSNKRFFFSPAVAV